MKTTEENNTRTRINFSETAKGMIQWDITAEYDTPEKSVEMAGKAIDMARQLIKEKGLVEVGADK